MNLKNSTIKKIMRSTTDRPITAGSVLKLMEYTERFIQETTRAADDLLERQNKLRLVQGMREKVRLSQEEIEEVINGHS